MQLLDRDYRPPRATRTRRGRWLAVACCLALALAFGPTALSTLWPRLQYEARALWMETRALPAVIGGGGAAPLSVQLGDPPGQHQYWQVGLTAGPDASDATGMRTSIATRVPQRAADHTTNYYWIGSYLSDGSFVQIGYYVAWYAPDSAGWFYCAFTAAQRQGPCEYGPTGSAGSDGSVHTYTLEAQSSASPVTWLAFMDGTRIGQFAWTSGTTGQNAPGIYAESSGFAPHGPESQLGPVDFVVPVQVRTAHHRGYVTAAHVRPAYDAPDICPPYGARPDGNGGALLGSGLACPSDATWLW